MDSYLLLWFFIIVMVGTPGPANLVAMIAGMKDGWYRCLYFIFGLVVSKAILNVFVGFGFNVFIENVSFIRDALKIISAMFMIWLSLKAWKETELTVDKNAEFIFSKGLFVHILNPKAWAMSTIAWSEYAPSFGQFGQQMLVIVGSFAFFQAILHTLWCFMGSYFATKLHKTLLIRRIMIIITLALVLSILMSTSY